MYRAKELPAATKRLRYAQRDSVITPLKILRARTGLTAYEVAHKIGVNYTQYIKYETGRRSGVGRFGRITEVARRICKFYGVRPSVLWDAPERPDVEVNEAQLTELLGGDESPEITVIRRDLVRKLLAVMRPEQRAVFEELATGSKVNDLAQDQGTYHQLIEARIWRGARLARAEYKRLHGPLAWMDE